MLVITKANEMMLKSQRILGCDCVDSLDSRQEAEVPVERRIY